MIVEFRTYRLKPAVSPGHEAFWRRPGEPHKVSPLGAFFSTRSVRQPHHPRLAVRRFCSPHPGPLAEDRRRPPNIRGFVEEQESEIFIPAAFSPKLEPRQLGGIYEIRTYTLAPGAMPSQIDRWSTQIAERTKLSPLAFAGHSELGGLNRWRHIWAYKDANHRAEVREHARKEGIWPPKGGQPGQTLVQENMLVIPASFSPLSKSPAPLTHQRYAAGPLSRIAGRG